ncbi:MAG: hypothetical protein IE922_04235 [Sphingomonadales bacterium]|nr:hypothetical protein [Sphingomonadales bacterium]
MKPLFFALGAMLALPAAAQDITEDLAYGLRCHFTQSCIGGGCGEETYDTLLEVDGAGATFRDAQMELPMTGGVDVATGHISFASEPAENTSYFISTFEEGGAALSIHTLAEGQAIGITFTGACWEDK